MYAIGEDFESMHGPDVLVCDPCKGFTELSEGRSYVTTSSAHFQWSW